MRLALLSKSLLTALLLTAVATGLPACGDSKGDTLARELVGKKPPELDPIGGTWFNVEGDALTLASQLGKVVYLEFGFASCPGCQSMAPQMQRWHEQYEDKGLVVISIEHGPQSPIAGIESKVRARTLSHPVLHDAQGRNTELYGVRGFPSAYLMDRNGKVVWEGVPVRDLAALEAKLNATLGV